MTTKPLTFWSSTEATGPIELSVLPPLALYVHIPWCVQKCPYCDFNSHRVKTEIPEALYVDVIFRDIEQALPLIWGRSVRSVFFGGGTPSLLTPDAVHRLLDGIRARLPLIPGAEITLEANPGTVDEARFKGFSEAGVNRLSIGVQSLNAHHLVALGRIHNVAHAVSALQAAPRYFERWNSDLMYALPSQSLADLDTDLQALLSHRPPHISAYHLTIEPNTAFAQAPPTLPDDDAAADMQDFLEMALQAQGYQRYEVSAWAQPGQQCRHNLNYWQFGDYLGVGAGAHSKISFSDRVIRQVRTPHPDHYLRNAARGQFVFEERVVQPKNRPFEFMMNALRLVDGVPKTWFCERTGVSLIAIASVLRQAEDRQLLVADDSILKPTALGLRFLNELVGLFLIE